MARETAVERRAREAREAQEAQKIWAQELPMRVLRDMARAQNLGVITRVLSDVEHDAVMVEFHRPGDHVEEHIVTIGSDQPTKYWEYHVSSMLDSVQQQIEREAQQQQLRQSALSKLSPQEREALGL